MMAAGKLQNLQDPVQVELMAVTNALKIVRGQVDKYFDLIYCDE